MLSLNKSRVVAYACSYDLRHDHLDTDAKSNQGFSKGPRAEITLTPSPDVPGMAVMNCRAFIVHKFRCWPIRRFVSVPRAVLDDRFYRSRSRHEVGETARTPHHHRIVRQ